MLHHVSKGLALAFLAGPWTADEIVARGREVLGGRPRWLGPLVRRVLLRFPNAPAGRDEELAALLRDDAALRRAVGRDGRLRRWLVPPPVMVSVEGPPAKFAVLPIPSLGDLADRLGLAPNELDWFCDLRRLNVDAEAAPLFHYDYRWVPKARGGHRLLEAPKPRMKELQRWLLDNVLAPLPVAEAAHGFVAGRNVPSFVAPHAGRAVVVRLDLEDFFASISRARIAALFRRIGYPSPVALALAALCTAATPERILAGHPREGVDLARRFLVNQRLRDPHLPQGSPTSPALSNLVAWRFDRRLTGLARTFGATFTRYADDLAFSGDERFGNALPAFLPRVGAIALEEGFRVNHRKTRVMRRGGRQQLCGVVVNERPTISRRERDRLRALLFNAVRHGPHGQNREGRPDFRRHLEGRISWIRSVDPHGAARLASLFARIAWDGPPDRT